MIDIKTFGLMNISGAKLEEHCFNISRDILYSVFHHFGCKPHDLINFLICKTHYPYLYKEKRSSETENSILLYFENP